MSATAVGGVLALAASVALNGSYLLQHAGSARRRAVDARRPVATLASLLRSPLWTLGAVVGCTGWALHIAAMREAPLSLVQAFVAGGLALVAPMAAFGLRRRLARAEVQAVSLMAVALLLLSTGLRTTGRHAGFDGAALAVWIGVLALGAAVLASRLWAMDRAPALGVAGGLLYGAADLAFKALTGLHGARAVATSPWLAAGALATAGAFFAFQRGLQSDHPVTVIALMTAATNVSSIAGAFAVYGDGLGSTPALAGVHAVAFALVVAAAWRLAPVQARLIEGAPP